VNPVEDGLLRDRKAEMQCCGRSFYDRRGPSQKAGRHSAILLVAGLLAVSGPAPAAACGLELVLAMDVSRSVVNAEFELQMGGLALAFRDPEVIEAIQWIQGGVMATMTQWSGAESQAQTAPWLHLTDGASAVAFAAVIENQERAFFASYTAVGEALYHANNLSATNPMRCSRRVIDVSGDGASNRGRPTRPMAEALAATGVTVNGLVILGAWPDPEEFYLQNVVRGNGAFLETAENFADYAVAIKRKLLRELVPQVAAR
jgi:Ca-activated chloride channel family protein